MGEEGGDGVAQVCKKERGEMGKEAGSITLKILSASLIFRAICSI
jgi:hypothetical protein